MLQKFLPLCGFLLSVAALADAYTVVLKSGHRLEAENRYEVVNGWVRFVGRNGRLYQFPLAEVNLLATQAANRNPESRLKRHVWTNEDLERLPREPLRRPQSPGLVQPTAAEARSPTPTEDSSPQSPEPVLDPEPDLGASRPAAGQAEVEEAAAAEAVVAPQEARPESIPAAIGPPPVPPAALQAEAGALPLPEPGLGQKTSPTRAAGTIAENKKPVELESRLLAPQNAFADWERRLQEVREELEQLERDIRQFAPPAVETALPSRAAPVEAEQRIELVENSTGKEFHPEMVAELYEQVLREMETRGLPTVLRPSVWVHLVARKQAEQTMLQCVQGGCGYVIRLTRAQGKPKNLVFLGISRQRVDVWMDGPHELSLAQALTACLNYQNQLYLNPDRIDDIAFSAWTASRAERNWKISVRELREKR